MQSHLKLISLYKDLLAGKHAKLWLDKSACRMVSPRLHKLVLGTVISMMGAGLELGFRRKPCVGQELVQVLLTWQQWQHATALCCHGDLRP